MTNLDRCVILRDTRLRGGGGEKILNSQEVLPLDFLETPFDIVAASRRDMHKDAAYELQESLSRLRTIVKKIDSRARLLLSIAYETLELFEKEEKRGEERDGQAKGSTQTR